MTPRPLRLLDLLALALMVAVATGWLAGCCPKATLPPPMLPKTHCGPAPKRATFHPLREGCPSGATCFRDADATALLSELESRRDFDEGRVACEGK